MSEAQKERTLVERLRDAPSARCPWDSEAGDKFSPDTPCPVCGDLGNDAAMDLPVHCIGTNQTAILNEAAAEITSLHQQVETLTKERDEKHRLLCGIADVVERHWRGAGLSDDFKWLEKEVADYANEKCRETDELETRVEAAERRLAEVREAHAAIADQWTRQGYMQLNGGEMTAQERRTVAAVATAIASAIRHPPVRRERPVPIEVPPIKGWLLIAQDDECWHIAWHDIFGSKKSALAFATENRWPKPFKAVRGTLAASQT